MTAIRCPHHSRCVNPSEPLPRSALHSNTSTGFSFGHPGLPSYTTSRTLATRIKLSQSRRGSLVGRVMGLRISERGGTFGLALVSNSSYLRACVSTIRLMISNALSARDSPPLRHILSPEIRGSLPFHPLPLFLRKI